MRWVGRERERERERESERERERERQTDRQTDRLTQNIYINKREIIHPEARAEDTEDNILVHAVPHGQQHPPTSVNRNTSHGRAPLRWGSC
jgi:hypothetical protein